jgi:hypothetical protein
MSSARATGLLESEVSSTVESGISTGVRSPRLPEARQFDGADAQIARQPDPLAEVLAKPIELLFRFLAGFIVDMFRAWRSVQIPYGWILPRQAVTGGVTHPVTLVALP